MVTTKNGSGRLLREIGEVQLMVAEREW